MAMEKHIYRTAKVNGGLIGIQLMLLLGGGQWANGQGVGIGTTSFSPTSDAALELRSTSSGLLITRMTQNQRDAIASPSEGLLIYQTDIASGFYYFNGVEWVPFVSEDLVVSSIDNLGNHMADEDVVLNGNSLVNTPGGGGIQISDDGNVSIGGAHSSSVLAAQGSSVPSFEGQNNGVISVTSELVPLNFVPVDLCTIRVPIPWRVLRPR